MRVIIGWKPSKIISQTRGLSASYPLLYNNAKPQKNIILRITNTVAVSLLGYWLFFARQALANRSQFAIGIDAFGSTINNNDGDRR